MGKKYVSQPIEVSLSWEAADAPDEVIDTCRIKYKNPNGTTGYWNATYDEPNRTIYYIGATDSSYAVAGKWTFWPYVTLTDGRSFPGEPITEVIYREGE